MDVRKPHAGAVDMAAIWPRWSRAYIAYLDACRRSFDGDLDLVLVLAVLGDRLHKTAHFAQLALPDIYVAAHQARPRSSFVRIAEIARATGIPRESVRRKLILLRSRAWVQRDAAGRFSVGARAAGDLRPLTESNLGHVAVMLSTPQSLEGRSGHEAVKLEILDRLRRDFGRIWNAWVEFWTDSLVRSRALFAGDLDKLVIFLCVYRFAAERLEPGNLLDPNLVLQEPALARAATNRSSLSEATSVPLETARRKVDALLREGLLVRTAQGVLRGTADGAALYADYALDLQRRVRELHSAVEQLR